MFLSLFSLLKNNFFRFFLFSQKIRAYQVYLLRRKPCIFPIKANGSRTIITILLRGAYTYTFLYTRIISLCSRARVLHGRDGEKSAVGEKMTTESNPYDNGLHLFATQHGGAHTYMYRWTCIRKAFHCILALGFLFIFFNPFTPPPPANLFHGSTPFSLFASRRNRSRASRVFI